MKKYLVIAALLLGVTGCSSISTTSDYNPAANFVSYTTLVFTMELLRIVNLKMFP
jgi:hypothetical protein